MGLLDILGIKCKHLKHLEADNKKYPYCKDLIRDCPHYSGKNYKINQQKYSLVICRKYSQPKK